MTIHRETRRRRLLTATGSALVVALLVRVVYLPVVARIGDRRTTLDDLRAKIDDARALAEQLPGQERALEKVRQRYHALQSRVGDGQSVARILEALGRQAKSHQLELVAMQPREDDRAQRALTLGVGMTLHEVPLTLQLTGQYRHIGEFLGGLPDAPFIGSVRKLSVTHPQAGSAELRAELVLAVCLAESASPR